MSKTCNIKFDSPVESYYSNFLSDARYDFTRQEMQILVIIIAALQEDVRMMMEKANNICMFTPEDLERNIKVCFSLNEFPVDMSGNEKRLIGAARSLLNKKIEMLDVGKYTAYSLIAKVDYIRKNRQLILTMIPDVWHKMLDFSFGYASISPEDLDEAFRLSSVYSIQLLLMVNSIKQTRTYTIEDLRTRFKKTGTYENTGDLLRKTIDVAKKELDSIGCTSFDYEKVTRPGSREIVAVQVYPKRAKKEKQRTRSSKKLDRKYLLTGMSLNTEEISWLKQKFEFTETELDNNFETFNVAKRVFGSKLMDIFISIFEYMIRNPDRGRNHKGYFIKAVKSRCEKVLEHPVTGDLFASQDV